MGDEYKEVGLKKNLQRMQSVVGGKDFDFEGDLTYNVASGKPMPEDGEGVMRIAGFEIKEGKEAEFKVKMDALVKGMKDDMPDGFVSFKGSTTDTFNIFSMVFEDEESLDTYLATTRNVYLEELGDILVFPFLFDVRGDVHATLMS